MICSRMADSGNVNESRAGTKAVANPPVNSGDEARAIDRDGTTGSRSATLLPAHDAHLAVAGAKADRSGAVGRGQDDGIGGDCAVHGAEAVADVVGVAEGLEEREAGVE